MQTEAVSCPLCAEGVFDPVAPRSDHLEIVRCRSCRLAYVSPRPAEDAIGKLYSQDYYEGEAGKRIGYAAYDRTAGVVRATEPYDWALLTQRVRFARLRALDVGCAFGALVYWMERAGAVATGIDLSAAAVAWGRETLGLDLRRSTLEQLDEPSETFDVVTMVDVIEHVPNLSAFLARTRALLKPGGLVYVRTPNFGCYPMYGDECAFLQTSLEHLLYFEPDTLADAFARAGFEQDGATQVMKVRSQRIGEVLRERQSRGSLARRLARRLPVADTLRLLRMFLAPVRPTYAFDPTQREGDVIAGFFRRPA